MSKPSREEVVIDPSAKVHPDAKIGKGSKVGPWVIIEEAVELGVDCEVRARAVLTGQVKIGDRNQIGYGAVIGAEPQDTSYHAQASGVEIGDENTVREYVTIHRGTGENTATKIGNRNFFMVGSHIAHNCVIGDHVFLVNNVLLGGYVEVQDHAFLGGAAVVHQFTRIGRYVMVRGQTRLGLDVPPYCMAVDTNTVQGLNRVGLKRNGIDGVRRKAIQSAYNYLYHSGLNRMQAIEAMKQDKNLQHEDIKILIDFLLSTTRGISQPERLGKKKEGDREA